MFKGAANTDTEIATQIQPRTWTRIEPFTRKCVITRMNEKRATFIATKSFVADTCNFKIIII